MRAVRGTITSSQPISLSKAAAILSRFRHADTGAPQDVAAYLRRASNAFDELVQFHREIRDRRRQRSNEAEEPKAAEEKEKKKRRKEKIPGPVAAGDGNTLTDFREVERNPSVEADGNREEETSGKKKKEKKRRKREEEVGEERSNDVDKNKKRKKEKHSDSLDAAHKHKKRRK